MADPIVLIVMRLADMQRVHPQMVTASCSKCRETVGIYPSGQRVLAAHADMTLVCHVCAQAAGCHRFVLAPGAEREPLESVPVSRETPKA